MGIVTDPVEIVVVFDRRVVRIDEDHFEPLLGAVFTDPVTVQHTEVGVLPGDPFLADALDVLSSADAVDALSLRASARLVSLLARRPLADGDASDDDTLFGLVAEFACFIESRRAIDPFDRALLAPLLFALPL